MSTLTNSLEWKPNKCQGGAPFFAVNILITCGEPNPVEIPYNISWKTLLKDKKGGEIGKQYFEKYRK